MYVSPQWELINPVARCRGNLSKNDKGRLDDCIQEMSRRNLLRVESVKWLEFIKLRLIEEEILSE